MVRTTENIKLYAKIVGASLFPQAGTFLHCEDCLVLISSRLVAQCIFAASSTSFPCGTDKQECNHAAKEENG